MDMENAIEDFNSVFDIEETLAKELKEFEVTENFNSLFNTKKSLLGEINRKKSDILKELKQLNELIEKEKEMFPKEYENIGIIKI